MYEIAEDKKSNLQSLALFVGTGECNAHCAHCAGKVHRKYAPKEDGIIDKELIYHTLKECYAQGARYLSLSGSGEPTLSPLSVTKALDLVHDCRKEGIEYSKIHLYSNGIRIGEDRDFCDAYLNLWRGLGLETMYVTVHDIDNEKNARIYGRASYPDLEVIVSRIHEATMSMRANLVLSKRTIDTSEKFALTVSHLKNLGVDSVSAWSVRGKDDNVDAGLSPLETELDKMEQWAEENQDSHFRIRLLREKNRVVYDTGQKLTLFPDGTLSNTWCNH
jgi:wyosine [tRNA(Phe)-imidazoG37] synthetase (radical SAM superfamily)